MCRWMAYCGSPIVPAELVLNAKHSIVAQSLNSPLGAETVNGDGFGFGWYPALAGADAGRPAMFHSVEPAWNDQNLRELAQAVTTPLFFTHVRAAAGPPIQQTNCHPFRHDNWLFMHNGAIAEFGRIKRELTFAVDASLYDEIRGTTDTEVLFHLALTLGLRDDPLVGLARAIGVVEHVGHDAGIRFPMQGTVAVTDGHTVWAVRYSSQGQTRSLFHSNDIPTLRQMHPDVARLRAFSDDAHVIVSEPLNDLPGVFLEVPESSAAILDRSGYRHEDFTPIAP